ncbi:hypothetical protein [Mucilaginibacter ginsenosidivorans]|nr:hypothetical protein [Mucilaginibacter ginsenosidivorans]
MEKPIGIGRQYFRTPACLKLEKVKLTAVSFFKWWKIVQQKARLWF